MIFRVKYTYIADIYFGVIIYITVFVCNIFRITFRCEDKNAKRTKMLSAIPDCMKGVRVCVCVSACVRVCV